MEIIDREISRFGRQNLNAESGVSILLSSLLSFFNDFF